MGGALEDQLSSVAGIVAATVFLVRLALRSLANVAFARKVPQWVYGVVIATLLTLVARYVLNSVAGDILDLVYQAVTNAAMAGGFDAWIKEYKTPLHETAGIDVDGDGKPDVVDVPLAADPTPAPGAADDGSIELE